MLNNVSHKAAFAMRPEGSLNHMPVDPLQLPGDDPLRHSAALAGKDLVSRKALMAILGQQDHPQQDDLRAFLTHFNIAEPADRRVLDCYAERFILIIRTARSCEQWAHGNHFQKKLLDFWQASETVVIAGGITSAQFGIHLASRVEEAFTNLDILASPWAGQTALFGLAQAVAQREQLLVLDFGGTGVKCGIAHNYGNRIDHLFEMEVAPYLHQGLVYADHFRELLVQIRERVGCALPVAISLACYMDSGVVFDYKSGIYHRLGACSDNLAITLNDEWLPAVDLGELKALEHDSTAAALAFQFRTPAMMVTLGTGLGSAPCPYVPLPGRSR